MGFLILLSIFLPHMKIMNKPDRWTNEQLNTSEDKERHTPGFQMFKVKEDTTDQEP